MRSLLIGTFLLSFTVSASRAADDASFLLAAKMNEGDTSTVKVTLEVGGDWIFSEQSGTETRPLTVSGELRYLEQLLAWSPDATTTTRSLREYQTATAKIQMGEGGIRRELPKAKRSVAAEIRDGRASMNATDMPLTRNELDLLNVSANSLALDRLLPGRELAEGDGWDHEAAAIGALLGMDHVAVCEVRSVVTGNVNQQVQIRLAGAVHGTIDGAPTEMELRGAYLFHQQFDRITKFNLAIKESRTPSQIVPGLNVVAKVSVTVRPSTKSLDAALTKQLSDLAGPLPAQLRFEAQQHGYRFAHDRGWYVTEEQRDLVALRYLQDSNQTAHCNVTTLPARSAGRETTLSEFERDVRESLGDNLETVTASTEWTTSQGHDCLGVVARGQVKAVPIEWRYYLISSPDLPRVSLGVTIEQSQIEKFDDADRQIVESLELLSRPANGTAAKPSPRIFR